MDEITVKIPESTVVSFVNDEGKEISRIHIFTDGDFFVNMGGKVYVRLDKIAKSEITLTRLDDTPIIYWQTIQMKKES